MTPPHPSHDSPRVASQRLFPPRRLAIYYGWPSCVNGAGSAEAAAEVFAHYHHLVLGWGLQERSHGDHDNCATVVEALRGRTAVYGYIPLGKTTGLSPRKVKKAAKLWRKLGVRGVLLDEAGYDYGNDRKRQNQCLDAVHGQELVAIVNAWQPEDLLSTFPSAANPKGQALALEPGDVLLYESYRIRDGALEEQSAWREKMGQLQGRPGGIRLWGVATTRRFDPVWHRHVHFCAMLDGLDAVAWGEELFSAPTNQLPQRVAEDLPTEGPVEFEGPVIEEFSAYTRLTSRGTVRVELSPRPGGTLLPR